MSRFLSGRFSSLKEYVPGEQPQNRRYIKLNTNESPFSPSPLVLERINSAAVSSLNLYPDNEGLALREKIADFHNIRKENVILSNGSDEILSFAFMAFCDEKRKIAFPDISYGFYRVYADLYRIEYTAVPLAPDFSVRSEDYINIGKNIVIANPNAPTGIAISLPEIEKIAASNPDYVIIIDEAYVDFGAESCIGLINKYDNLLVVQTTSKSRHLAGARLGFAFGSEELIGDLNKIRNSVNPYNVNRLTLIAGEAAFEDSGYYQSCNKKIAEIREITSEKLKALGFEVLPSKANFLFARHPSRSGKELYLSLKNNGILVRHFDKERIGDFLRITVGSEKDMNILCSILSALINGDLYPGGN